MNDRLRLGPVAVFLTVVAVILTVLATLTIATANADAVLADRFAEMTQIRYKLEEEGNRFLFETAQAADAGTPLSRIGGLKETEPGIFEYRSQEEGYEIVIRLRDRGGEPFDIEEWKIAKIWQEEDLNRDVWAG